MLSSLWVPSVNSTATIAWYIYRSLFTFSDPGFRATLSFVLRKVFASPAMWMIAAASMCIGMVRNSIDQFWAGYYGDAFHLATGQMTKFLPYVVVAYGTPIAAGYSQSD